MPSDHTQAWIAAYTRPRWEKVVASQLLKVGIQSYVPIRREVRQWSDRKKTVEVPLLPSYVLVQLDPTHYQKVFQADGIVRVITFNRRLAVIRSSEIDLLHGLKGPMNLSLFHQVSSKPRKRSGLRAVPLQDFVGRSFGLRERVELP